MITYNEACEQVGYDRSAKCPIAETILWYAYKGGEAKEFYNRIDATKFSKNVESKVVNKAEIDAWWKDKNALQVKAIDTWMLALKAEYIDSHFSEELFNLCYSEAYDRGHSYGYDEVASYMDSIVDFAIKVRACK
jgi:hypothetical protein